MFTANKLRPLLSKVTTTGSQVAEQRLLGKCLTTLPRIGGYTQRISAKFSSESAAPTIGDRIQSLVMTEEIAELL